jgi:surfactin synthase thioesterase subunit/acyl carrier protein
MMPGKHVGKVIVTAEDAVAVAPAPRAIHADGTYVITGGLAGIGLAVAESLASQGARHLALLGRSPPSEAAQHVLEAIRAKGAEVEVFTADVGDHEQMASVFAQLNRAMPRIRGVVHSAGAIDDGTIPTLDAARFLGPVTKAKIDGGWNLHQLTKDTPLDFFVLFSSIVSPIGSAGQGNYAAANAFLDALAHHRRALGLPATSIDWCPWSETGMATRGAAAARRLQTVGVSSADGLALFRRILEVDAAQVVVIGRQLTEHLSRAKAPLFDELRRGAVGDGNAVANTFLDDLAAKSPEARLELVLATVRALVADGLRLDPTSIDASAPLTSLGMDSLMALELRARIRERMVIEVSAVDIANHSTLNGLARFALSKLSEKSTSDSAPYGGALTVLQNGGRAPALRLVCFPPAGGEADEFLGWQRVLPKGIELCAVAYPGVGVRATEPVGSLDELVRDVAESLVSRPAAPLAFFGHSLGVVVALATCAELARRGTTLTSMALSAAPIIGPKHRFDAPTSAGRDALLDFMRSINMNTDSLTADSEAARRFLTVFAEQLAWTRDLPSDIKPGCPVALFAAERDVMSTTGNLAFWTQRLGGAAICRFDGDHNYVRTESEAVVGRVLELNSSSMRAD